MTDKRLDEHLHTSDSMRNMPDSMRNIPDSMRNIPAEYPSFANYLDDSKKTLAVDEVDSLKVLESIRKTSKRNQRVSIGNLNHCEVRLGFDWDPDEYRVLRVHVKDARVFRPYDDINKDLAAKMEKDSLPRSRKASLAISNQIQNLSARARRNSNISAISEQTRASAMEGPSENSVITENSIEIDPKKFINNNNDNNNENNPEGAHSSSSSSSTPPPPQNEAPDGIQVFEPVSNSLMLPTNASNELTPGEEEQVLTKIQTFRVEMYVANGTSSNVSNCCGTEDVSATGVIPKSTIENESLNNGLLYTPEWEGTVPIDLSSYTVKTVQPNHNHNSNLVPSGMLDQSTITRQRSSSGRDTKRSSAGNSNHHDMLIESSRRSPHLVLQLVAGDDTLLGQVEIPIKSLSSGASKPEWFSLGPPLTTGPASRTNRYYRKSGKQYKKKSRTPSTEEYLRKTFNLNQVFIIIVILQLVFVVLAISILLYHSCLNQIFYSGEVVAQEVLSNIIQSTIKLFYSIEIQLEMSEPLMVTMQQNDTNYIAHFLMETFNQSINRDIVSVATNPQLIESLAGVEFFTSNIVGSVVSVTLATAVNSSVEFSEIVQSNYSKALASYVNVSDFAIGIHDSATTVIEYYGPRTDCATWNISCEIVNYSDVKATYGNFSVEEREWYSIGQTADSIKWSPVYPYATSPFLGITGILRIPRNLDNPLQFIMAVDVPLTLLSESLDTYLQFQEGLAFIYNPFSNLMIANSADVPTQINNVSLYLIYNTTNEDINMISDFLITIGANETTGAQVFHYNGFTIAMQYWAVFSLQWITVVAIPDVHFNQYFNQVLFLTLFIALNLLIISISLCMLAVSFVAGPLEECTKQLKFLAALDFSTSFDLSGYQSPIKEISRIYESLAIMQRSLQSFAKYVPPDVVRTLVNSQTEATLFCQQRELTIFFSDIVDFTSITESVDLDSLIDFLGGYLEEMSSIIEDNEGIVDKYIGDAIMGLWNAPETVIDHPKKACEAALLYQTRLKVLRDEWRERGYPNIAARIGIHTGTSIVGNFGSDDRLNYTALGDSVNLASRLEGLNKEYGTFIMISEDTYDHVKEYFLCRPLDIVAVKGKSLPICVFELISHRVAATKEQEAACDLFALAFKKYQNRDFSEGAELFEEYLDTYNAEDIAGKTHLLSCQQFMERPPDDSWQGFRKMTTK